ncbi:DUF5130 family protein [Solicola sp. PLA-1-18]|uniref:DUF5130 family protein n=1 Tax=Solicola sp. PLA-1-18 TaxID=3380532 RepID=UPI003B78F1DC
MVPVPRGELTEAQRRLVRYAVQEAEQVSGRSFGVVIGHGGDSPRATAERQHAAMADPANAVLVLVDPDARALEIVTGTAVRRVLGDGAVALAALGMQGSFLADDLAGGIVRGLQQLAEHARAPRLLHYS